MKKLTVLFLLFSMLGFSFEETPNIHAMKPEISPRTKKLSKRFQSDIEYGRLSQKTNKALDALVRTAAWKLRIRGHKAEAKKLISEWEGEWYGFLERRDLGDHAPLSQWLAEKYNVIEFLLGKEICHALRLDDIKTINYAIPVVFKCIDQVDVYEYGRHFEPLCKVTSYWVTYAVCVGGTWGTGFLYCGPVGLGVEFLVGTFVAPKLNEPVWKRACMRDEWEL